MMEREMAAYERQQARQAARDKRAAETTAAEFYGRTEMILHEAVLMDKWALNEHCYAFRFQAPKLVQQAMPGQFVQVEVPNFLRRPFGLADVNPADGSFVIGVRLIGEGTKSMLQYQVGDVISVIGPLGHGFTLSRPGMPILLGGGTGIFPILALAAYYRSKGNPFHCYLGFRNSAEYCIPDFVQVDQHFTLCSEAGGMDFTGNVVQALQADLAKYPANLHFQACGPTPMLKAVQAQAEALGAPSELSLEARMGCGVGLCLGCSIPVKDQSFADGYTYVRCCYEGPVFDGSTLCMERL